MDTIMAGPDENGIATVKTHALYERDRETVQKKVAPVGSIFTIRHSDVWWDNFHENFLTEVAADQNITDKARAFIHIGEPRPILDAPPMYCFKYHDNCDCKIPDEEQDFQFYEYIN